MAKKETGDARARGPQQPMESRIARLRLAMLVAYAVMLALLAGSAIYNIVSIRTAQQALISRATTHDRVAARLEAEQIASVERSLALRRLLIEDDAERRAALEGAYRAQTIANSTTGPAGDSGADDPVATRLEERYSQLRSDVQTVGQQVLALVASGDMVAARHLFGERLAGLDDSLHRVLAERREFEDQAHRLRLGEANAELNASLRTGMLLVVVACVAGLIIGVLVHRLFDRLSNTLRADLGSLRRMAHEDSLTGLLNRSALLDAIDARLRQGQPFALLYIDLDGFKEVNDLHGHAAGDRLLRMAASRIRGRMRTEDTVARIGGDEFIAMADNIATAHDCEVTARHLLEVFERPFQAGVIRARIGASIGAAIAPASGSNAGELLNAADRAMYEAKRIGGNAFKIAPVLADVNRSTAHTR